MSTKAKHGWRVSHTLSLFVIINFLVLGVSIAFLLILRIDQAVGESQQTHVSSRVQSLSNDVETYLKDRQQVLSDHARFPVLVQTLMQPELNRGAIADFMSELTFLGESHQEVLLDFKGRTLHASQTEPQFKYDGYSWLRALMNEQEKYYIGISEQNGKHYWRLAQPIIYNGLPEGVLVAEIPVSQLAQRLNQSEKLSGLFMNVTWKNKPVAQIGTQTNGELIKLASSSPGIGFNFTIDDKKSEDARNDLLKDTALLIFVITLIMVGMAIWLGKRWFIHPIEHLQMLAASLSKGNRYETTSTNLSIRELSKLAEELNRMSNHIHLRENALLKSRDEMAQLNEYLKVSQAQLVHSEKMASLGTMAAGVAHEINNPISFIKNNVCVMREYMLVLLPLVRDYQRLALALKDKKPALLNSIKKRLGNEELDYLLQDIDALIKDTSDGTDRVKEIVHGLKSFARLDESERKLFDLNECVETTLRVVWNELKYKCTVNKQLTDLPQIYGNPGKINQVIMNLLVNAAQAIKTKGEITILTEYDVNTVTLQISDTGEGISDANLDKIFTPFFTSKPVGSGTGLGLSISHSIVEEHHGLIGVKSTPGEGSTFTVQLPIARIDENKYTALYSTEMEKAYDIA